LFADDAVVCATWSYVEEEENMPALRHKNEVIVAYVTTGARLKFYTYLDALKERAIHCDTDSVIYIQKCGQPPAVTCGDKLGDMTNEVESNEYIEEFVSGGPKNYAYKTSKKKTVCKVRYITPKYATAQLVNYKSIRDIIFGNDATDVITVRTERKINRKKRKGEGSSPSSAGVATLVSEPEEKIRRLSFHKRRRLDDFDSVRFGYIKGEQSGSANLMNVFKHRFTCIISGPSGCGTTSFCLRLIANTDTLCTVSNFRDIVWCFSVDSAIPHEQLAGAG
jgi:hypothetical protein